MLSVSAALSSVTAVRVVDGGRDAQLWDGGFAKNAHIWVESVYPGVGRAEKRGPHLGNTQPWKAQMRGARSQHVPLWRAGATKSAQE